MSASLTSGVSRAILTALDTAPAPIEQADLYRIVCHASPCTAATFDRALGALLELNMVSAAWDAPDDEHAPLDESRLMVSIDEAGVELLAAIWRIEAAVKSVVPHAPVVHEDKLAVTTPAYAVRFESREAMRAYLSVRVPT